MQPEHNVADELPIIYREALDAIGELERRGGRLHAARYRRVASTMYSAAWDADNRRRLEQLIRQVRATDPTSRPPRR